MSQRSFSRLAWSNLAAQAAEQIMIAASAIAAVVVQAALILASPVVRLREVVL
jgi:hypothetical protein